LSRRFWCSTHDIDRLQMARDIGSPLEILPSHFLSLLPSTIRLDGAGLSSASLARCQKAACAPHNGRSKGAGRRNGNTTYVAPCQGHSISVAPGRLIVAMLRIRSATRVACPLEDAGIAKNSVDIPSKRHQTRADHMQLILARRVLHPASAPDLTLAMAQRMRSHQADIAALLTETFEARCKLNFAASSARYFRSHAVCRHKPVPRSLEPFGQARIGCCWR
jgi:hypothetical protein